MPSFDIASELDMQEVRNAVDQARRETSTRYDFRGTDTSIDLGDEAITVESASDGRVEAAVDVLKDKLVKRKISLKAISVGEVKPAAGGRSRVEIGLNAGIPQDAAKELSKSIRDTKLKVQVQIQGNRLRVQGKKRDDLQAAIAHLKELDFRLPLQYVNFRD